MKKLPSFFIICILSLVSYVAFAKKCNYAQGQVDSKIILVNNTDYAVYIDNLETCDTGDMGICSNRKVFDFGPVPDGTHTFNIKDYYPGVPGQDEAHILLHYPGKDTYFGREKDGEDALSQIRIQEGYTKTLDMPKDKKEVFENHTFKVTVSTTDECTSHWSPIYQITVDQVN